MTAQTRMLLIGVIVPLVIAGAGLVAVLVALPTLPNPVAVHWGLSGEADGFSSPLLAILLPPLVVLAYSVLAFAAVRGDEPPTANQRVILAIAPFLAVLITVIVTGSTVGQSGLADATDAASIVPLLVVALVAGLAAGVAGWVLLPRSAERVMPDAAEPLTLRGDERAVWMQRAEPNRLVAGLVISILAVAIAGGGLVLWAVAEIPALIVYLSALVIVGVLAVGSLFWRVTVDRAGLRAWSLVGFPRFSVPLDQVESASAVDVVPMRDFGGWGIRFGGARRVGVITRGGEAIEVRRRDGSTLVVTVDNAGTGASLLTALALRGTMSA